MSTPEPRRRWEVSPDFPEGRWVDLTEEELALLEHDRAEGEARSAAEAALEGNRRTIEQSLADRMPLLRTSLEAVTANQPTLFAALPAAERRVIRDLLRQNLELTRLVRQLLEATD